MRERREPHTYLTGAGDYAMRRKLSAKRVGDCPAAAEKPAAS